MTACAFLGIGVVLLLLLSAALVPNVLEGTTFWGASPDAWSEVPARVGLAVAAVAVEASLWFVVWWLFTGEVLRRRLRRVVGGAVVLTLVVVAAALVLEAENAVVSPNCDRYAFDREAFVSGGEGGRRSESVGIADCGVLQGRSRTEVRALLGPPDRDESGFVEEPNMSWRYGQLSIDFTGNRVTSADMAADPGFDMS